MNRSSKSSKCQAILFFFNSSFAKSSENCSNLFISFVDVFPTLTSLVRINDSLDQYNRKALRKIRMTVITKMFFTV